MSLYAALRTNFTSKGLQEDIVDKLIEEYKIVKSEALKGDAEKVSLHSAKFSDMALGLIENLTLKKPVDIDKIKTGNLIDKLERMRKGSAEDVILTLAIPRAVRSLHSIRNKKDVAHVKSIDPDFFDIHYCEASCDWILSQIVCIVYGADSLEAKEIIESLCEKKIPWIEDFEDGSSMLLIEPKLLSDRVMLTLYNYYPKRITDAKIAEVILYTNMVYLNKCITKIQDDKMIHVNEDGIKLTRKGEAYVDQLLEKGIA